MKNTFYSLSIRLWVVLVGLPQLMAETSTGRTWQLTPVQYNKTSVLNDKKKYLDRFGISEDKMSRLFD
jgi:hypothetical protein